MTEYAVTVEYTGDFIVEADSADAAEAYVAEIIPSSTPDSDWYFVKIVEVHEENPRNPPTLVEQLEGSLPDGAK